MDLSILTVTYHSKDYIADCILSVVTSTLNLSYEHIIIDNGSADGTVELIEEGYSSYVRLIKNQKNLGFAAANNLAVQEAKGKYILFLNPDMQIVDGFLDTMVQWMDQRPDVGLAGCKLVTYLKTPAAALRPFKFPSLLPYIPSFLNLKPFFCSVHPKFFYSSFDDNLEQEVEAVRGAFMLTRGEIIKKLGFAFDPSYFILFEDIDLCKEVKKLGHKVVYFPNVTCIDYFGRSFLHQTKAWKYSQVAKSFKVYIKKWHSPLHLLWINFAIPLGFILRVPKWGIRASLQALKK